MGTRRFELEENKSSKFWEIELEGSEHTVRYGKIGTAGQSKTKSFDSDAKAQASCEKLIGQKQKKGYSEVTSSAVATKTAPPTTEPTSEEPDENRCRLELLDGSVAKFWAISLEGSGHTAHYGRIGSAGKKKTKEFDSPDKAKSSYDKLLKQKMKKGYLRVADPKEQSEKSPDQTPSTPTAPAVVPKEAAPVSQDASVSDFEVCVIWDRSLESPRPSLLGRGPRALSTLWRANGKGQDSVQAAGPFSVAQQLKSRQIPPAPATRRPRKPRRFQTTNVSTLTLSNSGTMWCSSSPITLDFVDHADRLQAVWRPLKKIASKLLGLPLDALL
jgi:predicted DNA-binding WGR domain protein